MNAGSTIVDVRIFLTDDPIFDVDTLPHRPGVNPFKQPQHVFGFTVTIKPRFRQSLHFPLVHHSDSSFCSLGTA